jgi:hypothetical protein
VDRRRVRAGHLGQSRQHRHPPGPRRHRARLLHAAARPRQAHRSRHRRALRPATAGLHPAAARRVGPGPARRARGSDLATSVGQPPSPPHRWPGWRCSLRCRATLPSRSAGRPPAHRATSPSVCSLSWSGICAAGPLPPLRPTTGTTAEHCTATPRCAYRRCDA